MTPPAVKATLTYKGNGIFDMACDTFPLNASGRAPSPALCRKIMAFDKRYADYRLLASLPCGKLCFTVMHIGRHAERTFGETSRGIEVTKYMPFPGKFNEIRRVK